MTWRILLIALAILNSTYAAGKTAEILVKSYDGKMQGLELKDLDLNIEIKQTLARFTYTLTYFNEEEHPIEGQFYFRTPHGATIEDFGYWVGGKTFQGSVVVEAEKGRTTYESTVRDMVDPALLEWSKGDHFKMRIFPVAANGETKVKIVVARPVEHVTGKFTVNIPSDFGKIEFTAIQAEAFIASPDPLESTGIKLDFQAKTAADGLWHYHADNNFTDKPLPKKITLTFNEQNPQNLKTMRFDDDHKRYFESYATLPLPSKQRQAPAYINVLWDHSLSEEPFHRERMAILSDLQQKFPKATFKILKFGYALSWLNQSYLHLDRLSESLDKMIYDGATIFQPLFSAINRWSVPANSVSIVFTNGLQSLDLKELPPITNKAFLANDTYLVVPDIGGDSGLQKTIAKNLKASILTYNQPIAAAIVTENWRLTQLKASNNVQSLVAPVQTAFNGQSLFRVRGILNDDGKTSLQLTLQKGKLVKEILYNFDTTAMINDQRHALLAKFWAQNEIDQLMSDPIHNNSAIQRLGLEHQLITPYTVRMVMENCEDYQKFSITPPKNCIKRPPLPVLAFGDDENASEDAALSEGDLSFYQTVAEGSSASTAQSETVGTDSLESYDAPSTPRTDAYADRMSGYSEIQEFTDLITDSEFSRNSIGDEDYDDASGSQSAPHRVRQRLYETSLVDASKMGWQALYKAYLTSRNAYRSDRNYYILSSRLLRSLNQLRMSELVLSNIAEIDPGQQEALQAYAYHVESYGYYKTAASIYRHLATSHAENPNHLRDLALIQERKGQFKDAETSLKEILQLGFDDRLKSVKTAASVDLDRLKLKINAYTQKRMPVLPTNYNKILVTANWNTDKTHIELYVEEPVNSSKSNGRSAGRFQAKSLQGYGPELYGIQNPYNGIHKVWLKYRLKESFLSEALTSVRVQVRYIENGKFKMINETVQLYDVGDNVLALQFDYQDKNAQQHPKDFDALLTEATFHLKNGHFATAQTILSNLLKANYSRTQKAKVYFQQARLLARQKNYPAAVQSNNMALVLNPKLHSARYNNACYLNLASKSRDALQHLNLLVEALQKDPSGTKKRFYELMKSDHDLFSLRQHRQFVELQSKLQLAH